MNLLLRIAGIWALVTTTCKVIVAVGGAGIPGIGWIGINSAFMYSVATLLGVASFTKRWWILIPVTVMVYALLSWVGF